MDEVPQRKLAGTITYKQGNKIVSTKIKCTFSLWGNTVGISLVLPDLGKYQTTDIEADRNGSFPPDAILLVQMKDLVRRLLDASIVSFDINHASAA